MKKATTAPAMPIKASSESKGSREVWLSLVLEEDKVALVLVVVVALTLVVVDEFPLRCGCVWMDACIARESGASGTRSCSLLAAKEMQASAVTQMQV